MFLYVLRPAKGAARLAMLLRFAVSSWRVRRSLISSPLSAICCSSLLILSISCTCKAGAVQVFNISVDRR